MIAVYRERHVKANYHALPHSLSSHVFLSHYCNYPWPNICIHVSEMQLCGQHELEWTVTTMSEELNIIIIINIQFNCVFTRLCV